MRRLRSFVVVAIALLALILPATAGASWGWIGWLYNQSPYRNAQCGWYFYDGTCSGWAYWTFMTVSPPSGASDSVSLEGFENNNVIRGQWIYPGIGKGQSTAFLNMGGYLQCHITWWQGGHMYIPDSLCSQ